MPAFFINWLRSLPDDQAAEMWEYFDAHSHPVEEIVSTIAESHPAVEGRLCGPPEPVK